MKKKEGDQHSFTIGQAMESLLKTYRLQGKFNEAHLISHWADVIGKPIAERTNKLFFKNSVLFVELTSAPLKHELNQRRSLVLRNIQQHYGADMVSDIVFM
jgi:predicted nucleic acid-binding Zn ribbon protein